MAFPKSFAFVLVLCCCLSNLPMVITTITTEGTTGGPPTRDPPSSSSWMDYTVDCHFSFDAAPVGGQYFDLIESYPPFTLKNLTNSDPLPSQVTGVYGGSTKALLFNGRNYIQSSPGERGFKSISFWIKQAPIVYNPELDTLLMKFDEMIFIRIRAGYIYYEDNQNNIYWTTQFRVDDNIFHHVAFSFTSTAGHYYLDGQIKETYSLSGFGMNPFAELYVGCDLVSADCFQGTYDDLYLYTTTITQAAVQAKYNKNSCGTSCNYTHAVCVDNSCQSLQPIPDVNPVTSYSYSLSYFWANAPTLVNALVLIKYQYDSSYVPFHSGAALVIGTIVSANSTFIRLSTSYYYDQGRITEQENVLLYFSKTFIKYLQTSTLPNNNFGCAILSCATGTSGCFDKLPPLEGATCGACPSPFVEYIEDFEGEITQYCLTCSVLATCKSLHRGSCIDDNVCGDCASPYVENSGLTDLGLPFFNKYASDICLSVGTNFTFKTERVGTNMSRSNPGSAPAILNNMETDFFFFEIPTNRMNLGSTSVYIRFFLNVISAEYTEVAFVPLKTNSYTNLTAHVSMPSTCSSSFFSTSQTREERVVTCSFAVSSLLSTSSTTPSSIFFAMNSSFAGLNIGTSGSGKPGKALVVPAPVDCLVGTNRVQGTCSKTCGGGVAISTLEVLTPAAFDGAPCNLDPITVSCNTFFCPSDLNSIDGVMHLTGAINLAKISSTNGQATFRNAIHKVLNGSNGFNPALLDSIKITAVAPSDGTTPTRRSVTGTLIVYAVVVVKNQTTTTISLMNSFSQSAALLLLLNNDTSYSGLVSIVQTNVTTRPSCYCPGEYLNDILWIGTQCGSSRSSPCPYGSGYITRLCSSPNPGYWQSPSAAACVNSVISGVANNSVNTSNIAQVVSAVKNETQNSNVLGTKDVANSITVLRASVSIVVDTPNNQTAKIILEIVSNVIAVPQDIFDDGQVDANSNSQYNTSSLPELLALLAASLGNSLSSNASAVFVTANVVLSSYKSPSGGAGYLTWPFSDISFDQDSSCLNGQCEYSNSSSFSGTNNVSLTLPPTSGNVVIHFTLYANSLAFVGDSFRNTPGQQVDGSYQLTGSDLVNSQVISATIEGGSLNGTVQYKLPLTFASLSTEVTLCAFWDFLVTATTTGSWSTEGCSLVGFDGDFVICECTHLTNFAVLTKASSASNALALNVITYVGLAISIPCLLLLIVLYFYFSSARNVSKEILMHLSGNLAAALLIFVIGVDRTSDSAGCTAVAILLHYFLLTSFSWMLIEGWYIHQTFVEALKTRASDSPMLRFTLFAYGVPAFVVVITASIFHSKYGNSDNCWLTSSLIWAFLVPVMLVAAINIVLFVRIMNVIMKLPVRGSGDERRAKATRALKATMSFFALLGLTWIFGILAIYDSSLAFQYLFTIFNSFQGLGIFIFHCVLDQNLRQAWRKKFHKKTVITHAAFTPSDKSATSSNPLFKSNTNNTKMTSLVPSENKKAHKYKIKKNEVSPSSNTNVTESSHSRSDSFIPSNVDVRKPSTLPSDHSLQESHLDESESRFSDDEE